MDDTQFEEQNDNDWKQIHAAIFGGTVPNHFEWTDINEIITVLNKIGSIDSSNHMFFPRSGGEDLEGAKRSSEKGAIELDCGITYIVKPQKLIFEGIDSDYEWNYFRLETGGLEPSGVYEDLDGDRYEEVTELTRGQYVHRYHWDEQSYQDEPLPSSARVVIRYFKGAFVIFKKTSIYNDTPETYDGRHDKLGAEGFKAHILGAYEYLKNK